MAFQALIPNITKGLESAGRKEYVIFNIEIRHAGGIAKSSFRYSALRAIHKQLEKKFGSSLLPCFPTKKVIGNNEPAFVDKRRRELEQYLVDLLSVEKFRKSPVVRTALLQGCELLLATTPEQLGLVAGTSQPASAVPPRTSSSETQTSNTNGSPSINYTLPTNPDSLYAKKPTTPYFPNISEGTKSEIEYNEIFDAINEIAGQITPKEIQPKQHSLDPYDNDPIAKSPPRLQSISVVDIHTAALEGSEASVIAYLQLDKTAANRLSSDATKQTPLHIAARHRQKNVCNILLNQGADPNKKDASGWTCMHSACRSGDVAILAMLLSAPTADACIRNNHDDTVLHFFTRFCDLSSEKIIKDIVKLLLSKGADINARNRDGVTPLHNAAYHGNIPLISALLENGAKLDAPNRVGESALHWAARMGKQNAITFMLEKGADSNLRGDYGTPLDIVYKRRQEIANRTK